MTATERHRFLCDHLLHRVNLLIAFRERYSARNPTKTLQPEQFRDLFRCAKDIAMLMVRFFAREIGIRVRKGQRDVEPCDADGAIYGAAKADLPALRADCRFDSLRTVLIAANRAVAHIEPADVDHGVTDAVIFAAIDFTEELVRSHIYAPNNVSLDEAMRQPNNRM
jgi:hypothetical protein